MKRALGILITTAITLLLSAPTTAIHCNGDIITVSAGDETLYIDDRGDDTSDGNLWVYLEDNGQEGLQSGSPNYVLPPPQCQIIYSLCYDPCEHANPDNLIV